MSTIEKAMASGLEGVVAADTLLSDVDGEAGRLVIAGEDVERLAGRVSYEGVLVRLWAAAGLAGAPASEAAMRAALGAARVTAAALVPRLGDALAAPDGMAALRAALAQLPAEADAAGDGAGDAASPAPAAAAAALARTALGIVGATPVFVAAWARGRLGLVPLAPDPAAGHAADFLRLVRGEPADAARVRALDTYLVTVADHGMNASTFAARVVASTGSDAVSAAVAAVGALKGWLHGGAPGPVLDMLDAVGTPAHARAWLAAELDAGRRVMGMGHRIYRVRDPRAAVLEAAMGELGATVGSGAGRLELARAVERAAAELLRERRPDRPLCANVEFYTAVLLDAVGLPRTLFSATFAVGRVGGWMAHVAEQVRTGRLIRPASRYVGPYPTAAAPAAPAAPAAAPAAPAAAP